MKNIIMIQYMNFIVDYLDNNLLVNSNKKSFITARKKLLKHKYKCYLFIILSVDNIWINSIQFFWLIWIVAC